MPFPTPDLTDRRFGRLIAIKISGKNPQGKTLWLCRCDCGNEKIIRASSLTSNYTTSCGCHRIEIAKKNIDGVGEKNAIDITGEVFGRLIATKKLSSDKYGILWECYCSCGNTIQVHTKELTGGHTQSCGCLQRDRASEVNTGHTYNVKHGHASSDARSSEYNTWLSAKNRCFNPNFPGHHNYGGRGIIVEEPFLSGENGKHPYECWLEELGPQPFPGATVERIDNNSNYKKGNIKWGTRTEQARNRRDNFLITYQGVSLCASEWSEIIGIKENTIKSRIQQLGWSIEKTLTTKVI